MPRGVAKASGEAFDSFTVHDAVGDKSHRAASHVTANIPLRTLGGGVGQASLAGAETRLVGGSRGEEESNVARFWGTRGARGAAVDAGGGDGGEELAVETGVAGGDSAITLLEEDISGGARDYHGVSTPDLAVAFWWLSDIGVRFVALG